MSPHSLAPQPLPEGWWKQDATLRIQGNLGTDDAGRPLEIYFGVDDDHRPCAHGSLVAMTGAGKTVLFHTLITSLVMRYSPSELQLILMDGKMGVSFEAYRQLPHARIISLNTPASLARSILHEIVDEMAARNAIFKKHHVEHFMAYRDTGSPAGPMPRILFIADEYQVLFEDDDNNEAAQALLRISEQARSVGIHMLLGSQHPAPAMMAYRDQIFSNFHLRMTMKVPQSDADQLLDLSPATRELILRTCDRTGRLVVNDHAGDDTKNHPGSVAFIEPERQKVMLELLATHNSAQWPKVILDNDEQPSFATNAAVRPLLEDDFWNEPHLLEQHARMDMRHGGFGAAEWAAGDNPIGLLLGKQRNIHGQAIAVLSRKPNEHLCILGGQPSDVSSLLLSSLLSCCLQLSPSRLELLIADLGPQIHAGALHEFSTKAQENDYLVRHYNTESGVYRIIKGAYNELRWRRYVRVTKRPQLPTMVVAINEPGKVRALHVQEQSYTDEFTVTGKMFNELVEKGPQLGIHLLLGATSGEELRSIMQPAMLHGQFRHKIALQMSEDDSMRFVDTFQASTLLKQYPDSRTALLYDTLFNQHIVFQPFSFTDSETGQSASTTISTIFDKLRDRPHSLPSQGMIKKILRILPPPASLSKPKSPY